MRVPGTSSALVLALGVACAPVGGPVTVEALVSDPDAEGGARLDDVVLDTVTDLRTGSGASFDVVGGLTMVADRMLEAARAAQDDEDMRARARGDDAGHELAARMSFDGTRWLAEDFQTLTMFSAFAGLEGAFRYAEDVGDDSGATGEHALVGLEAKAVASETLPITIMTSDNAAYAAPLDGWLLLRVAVQDGVPFAMSEHILAHEYGHRFFHKNVYDTDDAFAFYQRRFGDSSAEELRAIRLSQGVDEGLADLFSLGATGDLGGIPRIFGGAGPAGSGFADEAARRHLEGEFADAASYQNLRDLTLDSGFLDACGADDNQGELFSQASFNFYCLGTVLARSLWDASDRDVEVLRGDVQPAVRRALSRMGEAMGAAGDFDVDLLLEPIAAELAPGARRDAACAAFRDKFGVLVDEGRVPTCS